MSETHLSHKRRLVSRLWLIMVVLIGLVLSLGLSAGQEPAPPAEVPGLPFPSIAPAHSAPTLDQIIPEEQEQIIRDVLGNLWQYVPNPDSSRPQPQQVQTENGLIAYVGTDGHLYIMNPDGSAQTSLVNDLENLGDLAWSPGDDYLVFIGDGSGGRCVYKLRFNDSNRTTLTCGFHAIGEPRWSSSGSYVAFYGQQVAGERYRAWVVPAGGGTAVELAPALDEIWTPDWLDDDTVVLAAETYEGTWHIYRVDVGQPTQTDAITPDITCGDTCSCAESAVLAAYPVLSPDGSWVAYVGGRSEGDKSSCTTYYAVYLVDPAGATQPAKVVDIADSTGTGVSVAGPMHWSPDNQHIGVLAGGSDAVLRLTKINTANSNLKTLHGREGGGWSNWSWAPDGTLMAAGYFPTSGDPEVDSVDPDTDAFIMLAEGWEPAWSARAGIQGIELTGLEVTQGIQDLENSVVLVKDKPTFVRAHVGSTSGIVDDVTAELIGRRNGDELSDSPLGPANVGGNIDVLENPGRVVLNDSFLFELPASWRSGTVELEFQGVSHPIACKEAASVDNDCKAQVTFEQGYAPEVRIARFNWWDGGGNLHSATQEEIDQIVQEIKAEFPIPDLNWDHPYDFDFIIQGMAFNVPEIANIRLMEQRALDGCFTTLGCERLYLGVIVDPAPGTPTLGVGFPIYNVASGFWSRNNTYTYRGLLPHELGHCLWRFHTPFCGADTVPWWDYPYPNGRVSPVLTGNEALYGFHIFSVPRSTSDKTSETVYRPTTADLMSYCWPVWPSDWTYDALKDEIDDRYSGRASSVLATTIESEFAVVISGIITPNQGTGAIDSIYTLTLSDSVALPEPGSYALRFEDASGVEIASYSFDPGIHEADDEIGGFALLLPWDENAAYVALLHDGQQLNSRPASTNVPTVTVVYPNGGESLEGSTTALAWSAGDLDGDSLSYVVQYSSDAGTSWETLTTSWPTDTYQLNLETVAGSSQALIRVLVSDGFYTAQDESDGTFTVAKHPPQVSIQTPISNSLYVGEQLITLEGDAYDIEDGQLDDSALTWSSDMDGVLGSGRSLTVQVSSLTEGVHNILLTAQDSDGQTHSASVAVQVFSTRPELPATLSVAPATLDFTAAEGLGQAVEQILAVRNNGDGVLMWSANVDQDWIQIDLSNGTAPTNINVTIALTDLPLGEYTGEITITASEAANSPQTVQISLNVVQARKMYLPVVMRW